MFEDENGQFAQPGMMGQPQNQIQLGPEPNYDPYALEQVRQEIELAHEEYSRLMDGRPRLYTRFPR